MTNNTRVLIASIPKGPLGPEHFDVDEAAAPECDDGQVLCRTVALTIGAGQRAGLQGSASYAGAPQVGAVMGGMIVASLTYLLWGFIAYRFVGGGSKAGAGGMGASARAPARA